MKAHLEVKLRFINIMKSTGIVVLVLMEQIDIGFTPVILRMNERRGVLHMILLISIFIQVMMNK